MKILQPAGWPRPSGYAPGTAARGTIVFVSGQVGWDERGTFPAGLAAQVARALRNVLGVLAEAGGKPEHVARLTWYVTSKAEYLAAQKEIGAAYRAVMGAHYPAMSVVEVSALVEDAARVEIEATAVVPD
jgi:enamine deaminase RidA (YjgF/YER057c/UK114 family)